MSIAKAYNMTENVAMPRKTRQSVQLDDETSEKLGRLSEACGVPKADVVRRVIDWLDGRDDYMAYHVIGVIPPGLRDKAKAGKSLDALKAEMIGDDLVPKPPRRKEG